MKLLARLHPPLAGLVAGIALAALATVAQAQTKWDLPAAYPASNFHTENLNQFAADVDKATGGKLKITVHPNGSLFKLTEIKRAVVGYGRAEKPQVQQMIKLLLGLEAVPTPHDAADALAVAVCHLHHGTGAIAERTRAERVPTAARSWRAYRP